MKIVLASQSPRRKQILSQFDIELRCVSHLFDESSVSNKKDPAKYCESISKGKADSISDKYNEEIIIAADTIVVLDQKILEKPVNKEDAVEMLKALSGRTHQVITGVTCIHNQSRLNATFSDLTLVKFYEMDDEYIDYYIEKYKPFDKSGSYGIQDFSSIFVKSIDGCFFNVVGLPVSKIFLLLKQRGALKFSLNTDNTNDNI